MLPDRTIELWTKLAESLGKKTTAKLSARRTVTTGMPVTVRHRLSYVCQDGTVHKLDESDTGWFVYAQDDGIWVATEYSIVFAYTGKPYNRDGICRLPSKITVHRIDTLEPGALRSLKRRRKRE